MVIIRLICRIFKLKTLMADVPDVSVTAVAGVRGERKVDAVCLAVSDFTFTGIKLPLIASPCCDDFDVGSEGFDAKLKTNLVVTLTGCTVADCNRVFFSCNFNQLFCNHRSCHRGTEQVFVFINSMRLYTGNYVFVTEFIDYVFNV